MWKTLYWRLIYRYHMRAIHRIGWHWYTKLHPIGGKPMEWCQWCGRKHVIIDVPSLGDRFPRSR